MKVINYRKSKNSDGYTYTKTGTVIKGEIQITRDEFNNMLNKALSDKKIEEWKYLGRGDYPYMTKDMLKTATNQSDCFSLGVYWTRYFTNMFGVSSKIKNVNYVFKIINN